MEIDVNSITQIIGSLGFPIVACGYMMVTMNKTLKGVTDAMSELTQSFHHFIDKLDLGDKE